MAKNTIKKKKVTFDSIYPVGSVYISFAETNPEELFGGEWTALEDTFLLGASSKYPTDSVGGSDLIKAENLPSHTHTATCEETGAHVHRYTSQTLYSKNNSGGQSSSASNSWSSYNTESAGDHTHAITVDDTNQQRGEVYLPPYISVHMWRRVS